MAPKDILLNPAEMQNFVQTLRVFNVVQKANQFIIRYRSACDGSFNAGYNIEKEKNFADFWRLENERIAAIKEV